METTQPKPNESLWHFRHQVFAAVTASLAFFVTGEVRGWASPAVPSMQGFDGLNNSLSNAPLSKEAASWITSSPPIGAIPSALFASFLLQWIGRKRTLILALGIYLLTFIALGTAPLHESYALILVSRSLTGVAVGLSMPAAQIYVSECSTPSIRGLLASLPAIFMAFGISFTYLIGAFISWGSLSYICTLAPAIGLFCITFIPESPVWLNANSKSDAAMDSALWLRNETVMDSIVQVQKEGKSMDHSQQGQTESSLWKKKTLLPFSISMILMVFQQWTGVNTVIFNTVTIFSAAKVAINEHLASNVIGLVQLLATALSIVVIDKAGRRILLIVSGIVMTLSLAVTGAYFYILNESNLDLDHLSWIPLTSLIIFMIGYSIGFATIPFILMGELLPAQYRNTLGGCASSFNLLHTFLVLKLFSTLETAVGYHGVFWIYAINSFLGAGFVYLFLPETKGKSLVEIEKYFGST